MVYVGESYTLTPEEWELCSEFAARTTSSSKELYMTRAGTNANKIFDNIATGKAAEIAAYFILKPVLRSLTSPDFTAYSTHQKSYEPDLSCQLNNMHIHVKSTTRTDIPSWLFMKNDPVVYGNPSGQNIAALFVVTFQHPDSPPTATLRHLVDLDDYKEWEEPFVESQQRTKVAMYSDTLHNCIHKKSDPVKSIIQKLTFKELIAKTIKEGPNLPLDKWHFDILREQREPLEHLKHDSPKGAGLYYTFLYNVVKFNKPKIIVELGNRQGNSTACLAAGMDNTQTLYTVDIVKNLCWLPKAVLQQDNVCSLVGSSTDPSIVNQLPNQIDFLFIDTRHTYSQISNEWALFKNKLSDGAIVAADDINWDGMNNFIQDIAHFEYVNEPLLHGSGFLVFQYDKSKDKDL